MYFSTLAFGLTALLAPVNAGYTLHKVFDDKDFFENFDFFSDTDPTRGFVDYVDRQTANDLQLAGFVEGKAFMGVDHTSGPEQGVLSTGRKSIRIESKDTFTQGLFIADIEHMPGSICGVWPAFWSFGPDWPSSGEIDILEGVNTQDKGVITLHTADGCHMSNEGSLSTTSLKETNCNAGNAHLGCGQDTVDVQNYGDGFNDIQGGVYAMEWTDDHIAVWFFPRHSIPQDIASGNPNPSNWDNPTARFAGSGCDINNHFKDHKLIFDTTFCGDWAGSPDVWNNNAECSAKAATCQDYVLNNPNDFAEAYWLINSIKVYNQGEGDSTPQPSQPTQPDQPESSQPSQQTPEPTPQPTQWQPEQPSQTPPQQTPPQQTPPQQTPQPTQPGQWQPDQPKHTWNDGKWTPEAQQPQQTQQPEWTPQAQGTPEPQPTSQPEQPQQNWWPPQPEQPAQPNQPQQPDIPQPHKLKESDFPNRKPQAFRA